MNVTVRCSEYQGKFVTQLSFDSEASERLSSKRYTLLTGATGLVGRYLMRDLLLKGKKLAVLVRPTKKAPARERVETILQMWEQELGHRLPRPVILSGEICEPNLGLSEKKSRWVADYCGQIIHGAAVLKFAGQDRNVEPWKTNFLGTEKVVEFARRSEIKHFHYISTAYVCGMRDEVVTEDDLDVGQQFRNDYELSKFEAEQLVRSADGFETKTVYRPAVVVGDSRSGYTSTYHGLFLYLRLFALLVPEQQANERGVIETPIRLPMDGDEPRNLVPVDWVSKAITHLVCTREAHGRTYHLVPDQCTTPRQLIECCCDYFNSSGVEFCGSDADRDPENEFARKLFENTNIYSSYDTSDPRFDKSNLNKFAGHLVCPPIDREMIYRFLDFGKQNNWGRSRTNRPRVARWIESHLTEIALAAQKTMGVLGMSSASKLFKIGLDIHGPGGGQWQLAALDGVFEVTPGLPDDSCPVLKLSDLQINDLLMRNDNNRSAKADDAQIDWSEPLESVMKEDA